MRGTIIEETETKKYGYSPSDYKKFRRWGWLMLLSFGITYLC